MNGNPRIGDLEQVGAGGEVTAAKLEHFDRTGDRHSNRLDFELEHSVDHGALRILHLSIAPAGEQEARASGDLEHDLKFVEKLPDLELGLRHVARGEEPVDHQQ